MFTKLSSKKLDGRSDIHTEMAEVKNTRIRHCRKKIREFEDIVPEII